MELQDISKLADAFPRSGKMPVLFSSHGNPMEALSDLNATPFFSSLRTTGQRITDEHQVNAVLVISAHWLTRGTYVNESVKQKTIHDYYGFPKEFYEIEYPAPGSPEFAKAAADLLPGAKRTTDWGLDHGSWPILRHLFPKADVPVFEVSIDYYQSAQYHFDLARQLRPLRDKGVLVIGSGSMIHNLRAAAPKFMHNDFSTYGWEEEFDAWAKERLDAGDVQSLVDYEKQGQLGLLAAPTPDHYVPMLYSLALKDENEKIEYTFEELLPAFSNRGFRIG